MKFIIGVLVHKTLCFVFKSCNRTVWPPLRQVTIFVKQSTYRNEMKTNLGSTNLNKISKSRSFFFVSSLLFGKCSKFNIISSVCFNFSEQENSFLFLSSYWRILGLGFKHYLWQIYVLTIVIKAMSDFVSNNHSDSSIVESPWKIRKKRNKIKFKFKIK